MNTKNKRNIHTKQKISDGKAFICVSIDKTKGTRIVSDILIQMQMY